MLAYCEYPEPIVAAYIQRVRDIARQLPDHPDAEALQTTFRLGSVSRRLWLLPARGLSALSAWLAVATSTHTCRDQDAKAVYRELWRQLRAAGWSLQSLQFVAYGLYAVRMRNIEGVELRSLFDDAMSGLITAQEIGWL